jgi:hypothetical protein
MGAGRVVTALGVLAWQVLEREVSCSREALRVWEEGAGQRVSEERACTQRAVAEALRQHEQTFAAEKRALEGMLWAARAREEEAMRMAHEDQQAALTRARDVWRDETQARHSSVQREVQHERRRWEEANKVTAHEPGCTPAGPSLCWRLN